MKKIKVYIASPYTIGDVAINVRNSIDAFNELIKNGFIPFSPIGMSHFIHIIHPLGYEEWMEFDFEWLKSCDALLRLSGKSSGADREVDCAKENNIPVFYSIDEIIKYYKKENKI